MIKNEMTINKTAAESSQGEVSGGALQAPSSPPPPAGQQPEHLHGRDGNVVLKSGPLFVSSKGIGWTSWKKRWFILTKTSLVFFRSDPNTVPLKGGEVNLTLGGIDLNNSGSVVVKADKKLLTVLFPDGRAFTLKAEALDDLYEWKTALEEALSQAPSAALVMGQNGILKSDQADGVDGSIEQLKDKQPTKSLVIGRPILLALEDIDGSPSFLEKALRFIEDHGIKVEGILRQAADVDDVMHRIQEYEEGKTEFSAEEDAHVIGDCIKYFLRELPSSPVPASCCNALVEACRADRSNRVNAMREAICETFPEPNRKLLQRILLMMQVIASNKDVNRMSTSAVAACMAPLLLRPLLSGDCEIATDFDVGGDGSMQLLQAAAAANHAQAIVITLLEEYQNIFREGTVSPGLYSNSEEGESEDEEDVTDEDDDEYCEDENDESEAYTDDDRENASSETGSESGDGEYDQENASSGTGSESGDSGEDDLSDAKGSDDSSSGALSLEDDSEIKDQSSSTSLKAIAFVDDDINVRKGNVAQNSSSLEPQTSKSVELPGIKTSETIVLNKPTVHHRPIQKSTTLSNDPGLYARRPTIWGRTSAKKNLSMESLDFPLEEELEIQKLEATKLELQNKILDEVKENAVMQANLEQRKKNLQERRAALEKDVAYLRDQLQKERDKRKALEIGLGTSRERLPSSIVIDDKLKGDLEEITQAEVDVANLKKKVDELSEQLNQHCERKPFPKNEESSEKLRDPSNHRESKKNRQKSTEEGAVLHREKSTSKNPSKEGANNEDDNKPQLESITGKQGHKDQQLDSAVGSNLDSAIGSNSKSTGSTKSKRSRSRTEGSNSTSSALTKLTNRLNFLKERRTQIANELLHLDKGRISEQGLTSPDVDRGADHHHSLQPPHKGQDYEVQPSIRLEKGRGSEVLQSIDGAEKALHAEGQSVSDNGKNRTQDGQLPQNGGRKQSESQQPQVLDRGKSEGHVSFTPAKAKASGSKTKSIPRTKSR